jgi:hypothetical protein
MSAPSKAKIGAFGSLAVAAITAIYALIHAAGHYERHPIYMWVAAPYLICAAALMLPWGIEGRRIASGCVTALTMLIFTYFFYIEGLVRSESSTSPVIVIFAPAYLIVGGAAFWGLLYRFLKKGTDSHPE